jgi:exodeoxyribonuclease-3
MPRRIKLISWNVNGLNAAMQKGFTDALARLDADVAAIQETKLQEIKLTEAMRDVAGYRSHWSFCVVKKGYSGTAVYTRILPSRVETGIGSPEFDAEGRIVSLDLDDFILFNVYFPNGQTGDERLDYKLRFYESFFAHCDELRRQGRSLVICGDYNTAHNEIDLKNPKENEKTSGFLRIERDWIDRIVARGYVDTFRHLYPDMEKYSWWTYRFRARERNVGWRIDYFFVTREIVERGWLREAFIDNTIYGSDHCPVGLVLEI